ncbi:hypothetical protein ACP70R_013078 [Stipagrostis hirtigluma subsp. patula]
MTPDDALRSDTTQAAGSGTREGTGRPSTTGRWVSSVIAERVLASDVADYLRFRAVCSPWRRCSADVLPVRGVLDDGRFHPRRWIMLLGDRKDEELPGRILRHFLNTSTGQCIQVDVPELRDHRLLHSSAAEGLLFLLCNTTATVRLLNPLTRQIADLPPITGLGLDDHRLPHFAGHADDSTALLYFLRRDVRMMAFAKPGDESWVVVKTDARFLMPTMCFAGRFYGVTDDAIMTVDMSRGEDLVVTAKMAMPMSPTSVVAPFS